MECTVDDAADGVLELDYLHLCSLPQAAKGTAAGRGSAMWLGH